ncbi:MAG: carbohydrate-binding protein [Ginsengibacter sp.]
MKNLILLTALFFGCLQFSGAQTVSSLWNEYKSNPYNHPNIPNNSYAGYGTGIVPLPNPSATPVNVTTLPFYAIPDDTSDDQPAIQAAIDAVGVAGGGIVYLPAGNYILNKPLYIKYNNVIVRGDGSTGTAATILDFKFSLYSMYKKDIDSSGQNSWVWWSTGLVWIGPGDTFKPNGAPVMFNGNGYEEWRFSTTLANVTASSNTGAFSVTVDNAASLSAGMKILLCYQMPADRSFIKQVYGHAATESGIDSNKYVGDCTNIISPLEGYYYWPAYIKSISDHTITFDRPLRIKVDPSAWPVTIRDIKSMVTESGLENVQVKGYNTSKMTHLPSPTSSTKSGSPTLGGWNGVYINRSWNCWINNVRFVNLECGVIFSAAKNCSALNTFVTSTDNTHWYHHGYALRVFSSDNLIENFTIDGPASVRHGINTEWFSSGNVYSKGQMKVGTFDSHRGVSFDLIRTEITVANDAGSSSSGAVGSGPFAGKRITHWNIIQKIQPGYIYENAASRNGNDVFEPLQYPMGAFVAITEPIDKSIGERIPPPLPGGNLGSIVVTDSITDTTLINLYHAELALRKRSFEVTLEAEQAVLNGAIVSSNRAGFTGSGFADYINASGDFIEWTVNMLGAGSYSLQFRYANGGVSDRPLKLEINGVIVTASLSFSPTGGWTTWSVSSATANLIAGNNKVKLTAIGSSGPNVDNLKVEAVTCQPGTLEAEQAILNGAVVASNKAGYTGSGFVDYINASGDFIEWTVNAAGAGLYALQFRYSNGGATDRPLKLEINGVVIAASLPFFPTGGWTIWSVSSASASLIAGTNKIRLTAIGSSGPNVDDLSFSCNNTNQFVQRSVSPKSLLPAAPGFLTVRVAPNPVNNILNVYASALQKDKQATISIISASGAVMRTMQLNSSIQTTQLNVSSLVSGVYIIKMISGDKVMYRQFVKL